MLKSQFYWTNGNDYLKAVYKGQTDGENNSVKQHQSNIQLITDVIFCLDSISIYN
jgi:hypothetical protein